jgi:3-hydroxyisobutyrate dehydrogenase
LTSYCPVPGPVPTSPANHDYKPGFAASLMLKDLALSQDAAMSAGAHTALGAHAAAIYQSFVDSGRANEDFSGIINAIREA